MKTEGLLKDVIHGRMSGRRPRGRPRIGMLQEPKVQQPVNHTQQWKRRHQTETAFTRYRCSGLSIPPVWDIPLMHIHVSIQQKYAQIFEPCHFLYFISFVWTSKSDYIVMMLMWTVMSKMLDRICSVHMLRSTSAIKCRTIFTMEETFRTSRRLTSSTLFETKLITQLLRYLIPYKLNINF